MEMLNRLREETEILHREIEKDNLANKIMDHSISLEEYSLLLLQNYIAYERAEAEIANHLESYKSEKTSRLHEDLKNLGVSDCQYEIHFSCKNEAEAIGAAYVIEGSAMGGMLIGKEIKNCSSLESLPQQYFFNGERSSMNGWNSFLKMLRSREFTETEIEQATEKAKETFKLFGRAFSMQLSKNV